MILRWRRLARDFKTPQKNNEQWYDPDDDWPLIVSSFAEQYGIRLAIEDISWPEYSRLFSGISGDTALGRIITIRSERDPKTIKGFTSEQKRIRREWMARKNADPDCQMKQLLAMQRVFTAAYGNKSNKGV